MNTKPDELERLTHKFQALHLARQLRDSDNPILQRGYEVFLAALEEAMRREQ